MKRLHAAVFYMLVLVAVAYLVGPFVWLLGTSFMGEKEAQLGHWVPRAPTAANYAAFLAPDPKTAELGAATARKFVPAIGNSLIVAGWVRPGPRMAGLPFEVTIDPWSQRAAANVMPTPGRTPQSEIR